MVFANDGDQRLYRLGPGVATPVPLTAVQPLRFADLQFDGARDRLLCVAERAHEGSEPENFLAAVALATGEVTPLLRGADFYAFARVDPAGRRLAYLSWNHPAMPWDACELWVADLRADGTLAPPVKVAGGPSESIFQPAWSPTGELTFSSDRGGFANLYRRDSNGSVTCLCELAADFATPLWVFGLSTQAWLDERTLVCLFQRAGFWHLGTLDRATGRLETIETNLTELGPIFAGQGRAVFAGGAADQAIALHAFSASTRTVSLLHRPAAAPLPREAIAQPRAFDFTSGGDVTAHGLLYLPHNLQCEPLPDERPPLLVTCHGGPTASATTALNLGIQF